MEVVDIPVASIAFYSTDSKKMPMTEVVLLDSMGNDLSVVNAARVSFNKKSQWGHFIPGQGIFELKKGDVKLIQYLAKHGHWTPFGHCTLSFHIKAPIFVARQLVKHQVGLVWNEVSRRYVDYEPDYWIPEHWRARAEDKKQGSSDTQIDCVDREKRTGGLAQDVCSFAFNN
jgi:thymidylate synthase (FAD)